MKTEYLREKQLIFLAGFDSSRLTQISNLLTDFYSEFPREGIMEIPLEQYVYGRYSTDHVETFCYWLEIKLAMFGDIAGSPASQYGLWFGTHGDDRVVKYRNTKRYGRSVDEAYKKIKQEIVALLAAGEAQNDAAIARSMVADKFKGKLLAVYFPDRYLSIYAAVYLNDILRYFNLDDDQSFEEAAIYKQRRLISFKNGDPIMQKWTLAQFAMFVNHELYTYYYPETAVTDAEERVPEFPDIALVNPEVLTQTIDPNVKNVQSLKGSKRKKKKIDYVKKTIRNKAIGDRGEQIVKLMEQRALTKAGRPDLAKLVDWVSKREDGLGYDIESRDINGKKKLIEVKSTVKKSGHATFFLSGTELDLSRDLKNYYIYYVYDVQSTKPMVWQIANPFNPQQAGVDLQPAAYEVTIFKR
ncbi:MAG: DUF3883 domain-containing protein [Bacteroidetes bacterium]|nr:DUF3883 domain-containing protein [Bacteroidota bacterium]